MAGDTNLIIPTIPEDVDWAEWVINHPDCDTICEDISTGKKIRVFAFAKTKDGNAELRRYRDLKYPGMKILKGMSRYAIAGLV